MTETKKEIELESITARLDERALLVLGSIKVLKDLRRKVREKFKTDSFVEYFGGEQELKEVKFWKVTPTVAAAVVDIVPFTHSSKYLRLNSNSKQFCEFLCSLLPNVTSVEINELIEYNGCSDSIKEYSSLSSGNPLEAAKSPDWNLKLTKVDRVHSMGIRGKGVRIAHPDSGFRHHSELDRWRVREDVDFDFYDDDSDAEIEEETGTHGLHTGSTLISGYGGSILGGAPEAELVPLRVTSGSPVLLRGSVRRLRNAINYAVQHNFDVISMSLGTPKPSIFSWPWGSSLQDAVDEAINAGLILVAAAGNHTQFFDIYPAAYPNVISCAACNAERKPWEGSGYGGHVDVVAPGEDVWMASFDENGNEITRQSSGTSYATTHVASVAALWLSKHGGKKAIMRKARKQGIPNPGRAVSDAFRYALFSTAKTSDALPEKNYGYGLIDAEQTVSAPLILRSHVTSRI